MSDQMQFTDEDLTAYLDNEASVELAEQIERAIRVDADLKGRLDALRIPEAAIRQAFEQQLSASPDMPPLVAGPAPARPLAWGVFAGGAGVGLAAGLLLAFGLRLGAPDVPHADWVHMVANYQALYVPETLANGPPAPADVNAQRLADLSVLVGADLTGLQNIEGLEFRRAQQLGFGSTPLIQIAYQLPDGTPVAICILRRDAPPSTPGTGLIEGLATAHWTTGQHGVVVIGGKDLDLIDRIAPVVNARI